jgi:glycosyltransferase involved in cell wall biosynthesis
MRVLLAAHAWLPRSTAGVEVYTHRLARALLRLGHEVHVLAAVHDLAAPHGSLRDVQDDGLAVHELVNVHAGGTLEAAFDDEALLPPVRALLSRLRPDVVHLQHLLNLPLGIVSAAHGVGAAVALTLHDHALSCARDGLRMRADLSLCETVEPAVCAACLADSPYLVPPLQRGASAALRRVGLGRHLHRVHAAAPRAVEGLLRGLRRLQPPQTAPLEQAVRGRLRRWRDAAAEADVVLTPTAFERERALEAGLHPGHVRHVALGAVGESRARPPGPRRRFAFVGTVAPHKGVHVLVEAFRGVRGTGTSLDVHGSLTVQPAYADALRALAAGDPRIRLAGPFCEGAQAHVLAACDALVVPSVWWENSPLTVLEAVAAGRPVVASRTGGIPEILPEGAGVLVPPGDVDALRSVLQQMADGELLAEAAPPFPLKTVEEGAVELAALYGSLVRQAAHA